MNHKSFYYNCSADDINAINAQLHDEICSIIRMLIKRETQAEINADLFWLFSTKDWCYDTVPANTAPECPFDLDIMQSMDVIRDRPAHCQEYR